MKRHAIFFAALLPALAGAGSAALAQNADSDAQVLNVPMQKSRFRLRVMAWNLDIVDPAASKRIPLVAKYINALSPKPDVIMLNEIRGFWASNESGDVSSLASLTNMPYYRYLYVTNTGFTGSKGVAVLSRYPFLRFVAHPAPKRSISADSYGTLEAIVKVGNVYHHVFSTRFDAHDPEYNAKSHDDAVQFIKAVDSRAPVLIGGDFNAEPTTAQQQRFHAQSGLKDTYVENPDPSTPNHIDYLFYRGSYGVHKVALQSPWSGIEYVSDHPWVLSDLSLRNAPNLFDRGGVTYTNDPPDVVGVAVDRPTNITMQTGYAMFVLRTPGNVTWRKEMQVFDNAAGTGSPWAIATQDGTHESTMIVPVSALKNGLIVLRKEKGVLAGGMTRVTTIPTPANAKPGNRYTFTWEHD